MATDQAAPNKLELSFHKITSTYSARFGRNDDQGAVTEKERKNRQKTAAEGTDQYYDFATSAYLSGWGTHFHYCPFAPNEPIQQAMAFYEHRLAHLMQLKPGMRVLDVGCGVGGPAREIAKFIGCHIVGVTINQRQVDTAVTLTTAAGLSDKVTFVCGDFLNLPFPDASFDAAYAIEATVHAPSLAEVYAGIARCIKPGGVFGLSEWVLHAARYDAANDVHVGIRNRIERGNAISNLQTDSSCRQAILDAGFAIEWDQDFAEQWTHLSFPESMKTGAARTGCGGRDSSVSAAAEEMKPPMFRPWYYPLAGMTENCVTWTDWWVTVRMTWWARMACYWVIWILEHLHLYPQGTLSAMATMAYCVDSVVEGAKEGIFTPCWFFVGRKPGGENMRSIGLSKREEG